MQSSLKGQQREVPELPQPPQHLLLREHGGPGALQVAQRLRREDGVHGQPLLQPGGERPVQGDVPALRPGLRGPPQCRQCQAEFFNQPRPGKYLSRTI